MIIEIDESWTEPTCDAEVIMHAVCWDKKLVTETANDLGISERQVCDVIAKEFRTMLCKLIRRSTALRELQDED